MKKPVPHDILRFVCLQKIEKCHQLRGVVSYFHRLNRGDPDYSYVYLHRSVQKLIERMRRESNRKELRRVLPIGRADGKHNSKGERARSETRAPKGVCRNWFRAGNCPRGDKCNFEHGDRHRARGRSATPRRKVAERRKTLPPGKGGIADSQEHLL